MHCCARNIERLTRIPKLRTDLQSRFVEVSGQVAQPPSEPPFAAVVPVSPYLSVSVSQIWGPPFTVESVDGCNRYHVAVFHTGLGIHIGFLLWASQRGHAILFAVSKGAIVTADKSEVLQRHT